MWNAIDPIGGERIWVENTRSAYRSIRLTGRHCGRILSLASANRRQFFVFTLVNGIVLNRWLSDLKAGASHAVMRSASLRSGCPLNGPYATISFSWRERPIIEAIARGPSQGHS